MPQQGSKVGRKSGFIAPSAVCWHSADNAGKKPPAHPPYALIVEVISESTARIDRREKLLSYIRINSLVEYLIVEQASRTVEIYRRRNDWLPETVEGEAEVRLDSLDCTITLDDLYADLALLAPTA